MIEERSPRSTAAMTLFLLFAAVLFGVTPAEASIPRGGAADGGPASLQLHELAPSTSANASSRFAEGASLLDVEGAPGCFGLFGLEMSRCERTYARNNPLKYVDPDGKAFVFAAPFAAPAAAEVGAYVGGAVITYFLVQQAMERFTPGFHGRFSSEFGRAPSLHLSEEAKDSAQGSTGKPGTYRPARGLPTKENGEPKAEEGAAGPHTQLGTKEGSKGDYTKGREFDANGKPVKDIDFTDHGRKDHPNPHEHVWEPNPTGGTPQRRPARPLQGEEQLP